MSTSEASRHLERNQLLLALPRTDYKELQRDLQDVTLPQGRVLFQARERITHVYFPQRCVISLVAPIDGEKGVEVAIVGSEGMAGLSVFLGVDTASIQAVSQIPDAARRLTVAAFRRALARGTAMRRIMLRYTDALLSQLAQCSACNQRHRVVQRCARWFLMTHDRVGDAQFSLTQEFLGQMLDVERPTVSAAARQLQAAGAIQYSRGRVTVTNRASLEGAACTCYRLLVQDYARAFA
ncbi:MAG TPA: Crp/Fnr family transcriptional regulator [Gemmatimonadaceae bacterium]|nr:Crp/Fnr family transcriptional regulator [Gemmatimonadaceae bacterium]